MNYFDILKNTESFKGVINSKDMIIKGTNDSSNIALIAADFLANENSLFVVLPTLFDAQKYYDDLINILPEEFVLFFPADELITAEMLASSGDFKYERLNTLASLALEGKKLVVTHTNGAIKYEYPRSRFIDSIIDLRISSIIKPEDLCRKLVEIGYERVYTTIKTGQFSHRGSIVDIFPLNYDLPIRIDFFDDEIDTIKSFDVDSQRSVSIVESIRIIPITELVYTDAELALAKQKISSFMETEKLSSLEEEKFMSDINKLEERKNLDMMMKYISFFTTPESIFDYANNKRLYFIDPIKSEEIYNHLLLDLEEYCKGINGYSIFHMNYFADLKLIIDNYSSIKIEGLRTIPNVNYDMLAENVNPLLANIGKIKDFIGTNYKTKKIICFIKDKARCRNFEDTLIDAGIPFSYAKDSLNYGTVYIEKEKEFPSFELFRDNLVFVSEKTIFEISRKQRKIKYKSVYSNTVKINNYDELNVGDYVVHYDYGVGRYLGIKTLDLDNVQRDFIQIEYANESSCYVPVDQVTSIMKYEVTDETKVKLSSLSSGEWARAKMKVRNRIHDISAELIRLYASRSQAEGFRYSPDSQMQIDFEHDFEYELTADQQKAVNDIKSDMESGKPMDRLVCGDVGYGKTEVAMRACFKAVLDGKQVACLAPTTILSRQHYYSFKNRMEKYGVSVELLNRFISPKKQKDIIARVKSGSVDVLIGTHRILSKEIEFKDLGLLIIDEEQRFGVTHKERIKEMKVNVDAITLSATPIPRTLQMSIVGIKDLSMIETPPKNRYPIQTYVLKRNDTIIREAITRELARGGQVFYLYNYTETIQDVADHIKKLVPEARICIGYGKLSKTELENVICSFIEHEYDVLVCTTIIETGIDMPDTNTLMIHDADMLGLSQLYQIRGRVGRSNKIAYAYLMYDETKILTSIAETRLETIKEFNALGSGFKIAMRDLAIRGAGDLLGEEQSGFIDSVGLETYMRILEEEVDKMRGVTKPVDDLTLDSSMNVPMANRTVDKNYIDNEDMRIQVHKKIDNLKSIKDIEDLKQELSDRFGACDKDLEEYMYEHVFKYLCKKLGFYKIQNVNRYILVLYMKPEYSSKMNGQDMFMKAIALSDALNLGYIKNMITLTIDTKKFEGRDYLKVLATYLDSIYYSHKID